jgi:hypothetical protein
MQRAFTYRAIAPMMWMLVAIGTVELFVTHLLMMFWHPLVAAGLSVASLAALGWLIAISRSFERLPVLLTDEQVFMRVGSLRQVIVPLGAIKAMPTEWTAERLKQRGVVNLALLSYPNVMLELDPPIPARRTAIKAVAHRLDDPAAFTAALNAVGGAA